MYIGISYAAHRKTYAPGALAAGTVFGLVALAAVGTAANAEPSIDAAMFANGKTYFFKDIGYYRLNGSKVEPGYPKLMRQWKGLPRKFQSGLDAALYFPERKKIYFFKGNQYVRITGSKMDKGYPNLISRAWQGMPARFHSNLDAAVYRKGHTYFFKGGEYVRFTGTRMDKGYPRKLPGGWGFPGGFRNNLDAAFRSGKNKRYYVFKGNRYIRLTDIKLDKGYPRALSVWKGLSGNFANNKPKPKDGGSGKAGGADSPYDLSKGILPAQMSWLPQVCPNLDFCSKLVSRAYDVQLRSYVPPRFVAMGGYADLVATRDVPKYGVRAGCRFDSQEYKNRIRDDQTLWEEGLELGQAILAQWGGALKAAKSAVASSVAGEICTIVDDSNSCRSTLKTAITAGLNAGMVALGLPPEIPDLRMLREQGINYLASEAVSIALSNADKIAGEAVPGLIREQVYERAFDAAKKALTKELNTLVPSANYDPEKPESWGYMVRAYSPRPAQAYVTIKRREGIDPVIYGLMAQLNMRNRPQLALIDRNKVWGLTLVPFPEYVPAEGLILPIVLKPSYGPKNAADRVPDTKIPGQPISDHWLNNKFGMSAYHMRAHQTNLDHHKSTSGQPGSDWDLFYSKVRLRYDFQLAATWSAFGPAKKGYEPIVFSEQSERNGIVWDAVTGLGIRKTNQKCRTSWWYADQLKDYMGRIDPPKHCNGHPNLVNYLDKEIRKRCY